MIGNTNKPARILIETKDGDWVELGEAALSGDIQPEVEINDMKIPQHFLGDSICFQGTWEADGKAIKKIFRLRWQDRIVDLYLICIYIIKSIFKKEK